MMIDPTGWQDGNSLCATSPEFRVTKDGYFEIKTEATEWGSHVDRDRLRLPIEVLSWANLVDEACLKHTLPNQIVLGVIAEESAGNAKISSPAGAQGLMQLMPLTANSLAHRAGLVLAPGDILDPKINVDLGCMLLSELVGMYDANWVKVFFAYNAGSARNGVGHVSDPTAIVKPNRWGLVADVEKMSDGTYVTVDYAGRVMAYSNAALDHLLAGSTTLVDQG